MKHTRTSLPLKVLSTVLCCLLAGGMVGFGFLAWYYYEISPASSNRDEDMHYTDLAASSAAANYEENARGLMVLTQHRKELTYLGKEEYKRLRELLSPKHTNFRFQILDLNGTVVADNLEGAPIDKQVSEVYSVTFPLDECGYVWSAETSDHTVTYDGDGDGAAATETTENLSILLNYNSDYITAKQEQYPANSNALRYVMDWGIDPKLPVEDNLTTWQKDHDRYASRIPPLIAGAVACGVLYLACLVWLLLAAGHKWGEEGIYVSPLHRCPFDLLLALTIAVVGLYSVVGVYLLESYYHILELRSVSIEPFALALGGTIVLGGALLLPLLTTFTVQCKDRSLLRRCVIVRVLRWVGRKLKPLLAVIPEHVLMVLGVAAFLVVYGALACISGLLNFLDGGILAFWLGFLMAAAAMLALLWWLRGWKEIRRGGKALAEGELSHVTDTQKLPPSLRGLGADLNDISQGMQKAVDQRMRSDRFRTELITNVSHDLKTPLTSIISYVDLLKQCDLQDETAAGYVEVLDRKSQRLKTLTEDLIEASKASAGVLSVHPQRLELCQLVRQALGEYEERLTQARLTPVPNLPGEPVPVLADGRHLWRILDNLLSNCAKYALPGTRVYVDVKREDGRAALSVKNISADPLNVPPEELLQRFVRGDASRSGSGSGLGLSIAQSLAVLQNGTLDLAVDGDLFKVTVTLPAED